MPGSPEILLGTATCFEYSRSYFSCNIRCDRDVIDTYLSLRYICYKNFGTVYIKLNFEALRVFRQCEPSSVFDSGRDQVTCYISVVSVDHYVIQGLELCPAKNRGNSKLKRIYYKKTIH